MDFLAGPPSKDEFEVSVFGPGTGEAIVLHLGNGAWGIVDSCRYPRTNEPAPLVYLKSIGVDTSQVRFVFASHWHDDHIQGLAETLDFCPDADFGCSQAYTGPQFEAVILEFPKSIKSAPIQEMRRCFELVENRPPIGPVHHTPTRIVERSRIWISDDGAVTVRALAPTPQAVSHAENDIVSRLLPLAKKRLSFGKFTSNRGSIVVVADMPGDSVLLGGDLEEAGSRGSGWSAVIARLQSGHTRGSVFKVPHHGSANADHDGQWTQLLTSQPISICTSYAPSRLPRLADISRILSRSARCYIAGMGDEYHAPLGRAERNAMAKDHVTIERPRKFGHVRLRQQVPSASGWSVEVSDGAGAVTTEMLQQRSDPGSSKRRKPRGRR